MVNPPKTTDTNDSNQSDGILFFDIFYLINY